MVLEIASIYLTNSEKKVQGGLGFNRNGFPNALVLGVFSRTFLLGLGTDG